MNTAMSPAAVATMQAKAEDAIMGLMRQAVWRANGGMPPTAEAMKACSVVEEVPATGQIVVRWRGEVVLVLSPGRSGLRWEFMGAAVNPALDSPATVIGG